MIGRYFAYIIIGADEEQQHGGDASQPVAATQRQMVAFGCRDLLLPGLSLSDALLHHSLRLVAVYALQLRNVLFECGGTAQLLQKLAVACVSSQPGVQLLPALIVEGPQYRADDQL